jgi:DNA polymerase/3'-5' exonuclease PolX
MSSSQKKQRWAWAQRRADHLVGLLVSACDWLAIAGSLRRKEPLVGDIELVAIPRRAPDLLGEPGQSLLEKRLWSLVERGLIAAPSKSGDRYKRFTLLPAAVDFDEIEVDLFITTPECWGVILALRTGPAEFSKRLVRQHAHGGLLLNGLSVAEGRVWRHRMVDEAGDVTHAGEPLDTSTEEQFFALTAGGWVDPWERGK